ncbi:MAG: hypothetical protein QOJ39_1399 [Candidatus Eremiobacteraeota bacterium]|nr:hypothetical protein [Candidatus Eremiobacteraeota bacterium]
MPSIERLPLTRAGNAVGRAVSFGQRYAADVLPVLAAVALTAIGDWYTIPQNERHWGGRLANVLLLLAGVAVIGSAIAVSIAWRRDQRMQSLEVRNQDHVQMVIDLKDQIETRDTDIAGLEERLEAAENERAELVRNFLDAQLELMAAELGHENNERISVYVHDGEKFVRASRFAESPVYGGEGGRTIYPTTQGCIGQAWRDRCAVVTHLPDWATKPDEYLKDSERRCELPPDIARQIRMKSQSYFAHRLRNEERRPAGVIVFESLSPQLPKQDELGQYVTICEKRLERLLSRYREVLAANREGGL